MIHKQDDAVRHPTIRFDPYGAQYCRDPGSIWRKLLELPQGVQYAGDLDMWLITKNELVRRALRDTEHFSNTKTLFPVYEPCSEALAVILRIDAPPTTAAADHPTHTRTRKALKAAFGHNTERAEAQYGPIVRRRVDELVARLAARRGDVVDLLVEFAAQLPVLVVADILGVPERDVSRIKAWADGQIALVWGQPGPQEQVRLATALLEFWQYCQQLVSKRMEAGWFDTDFISRVLRHRNGDDTVLTEAEVASLAFNLLVAGHETTAGLLAHALDQALSTPGQWKRFVDDPDSIPAFVEEVLRLRPAIDGWLRLTTQPVTMDGVTIPAGARCLLLIGAANRDPAAFAYPDRFEPARGDGGNQLTFGHGPHYCIGAALARLEVQVALTQLSKELPNLRLTSNHVRRYGPNAAFRVHLHLPAVVDVTVQE